MNYIGREQNTTKLKAQKASPETTQKGRYTSSLISSAQLKNISNTLRVKVIKSGVFASSKDLLRIVVYQTISRMHCCTEALQCHHTLQVSN